LVIREIPEYNPMDYVIELYATDKEMTVSELKVSRDKGQMQPISRSIVSVNSTHFASIIQQSIENMKLTAELREKEMTNH
jgi:glycine betaine/choline ABC-type transport system substrate-binding protein